MESILEQPTEKLQPETSPLAGSEPSAILNEHLDSIFKIIKTNTGHDFSAYKLNTIMRRIERRMTSQASGSIEDYIAFMEKTPQEAQALCGEILIGVTSFFRDRDAFEMIRNSVIPRLFNGRDPEDPIRIWHACCATGEEVYSMAMLIREYLSDHQLDLRVQFFATDIDESAIARARTGLYTDSILEDVSEERLKTFFTRAEGKWQI